MRVALHMLSRTDATSSLRNEIGRSGRLSVDRDPPGPRPAESAAASTDFRRTVTSSTAEG